MSDSKIAACHFPAPEAMLLGESADLKGREIEFLGRICTVSAKTKLVLRKNGFAV